MFYQNPGWTFRITGIFSYERGVRDVTEMGRTHTAISYRIRGNSTFYTKGQNLRAETGSVVYIPPGVDYRHKTDKPEKVIILHLQSMGQIEDRIQVISNAVGLEPLFLRLLETWEEGGLAFYNRCMSLLYGIFAELLHRQEQDAQPVPAAIGPGIQKMRRSFRDPRLTVAELARECFVSEVYFRRVYRAYAGESPLQTLLNLRFQYARDLLRSGYYTPTRVAELSGFSDVKYFRVAFKKRYGETPSEYMAHGIPDGEET